MKTMLILIIIILMFASCTNMSETVENPKTFTTVELQELPKDTCVISVSGKNIYIFNEDGEIVMHGQGITRKNKGNIYFISISAIIISFLIGGIVAANSYN